MWARTVAAGRVLALSLGVVVASLLLVGPAGAATTISSHGDASWGHDSAPWIAETPSLEPERVTCTPTALVASLGVVDAVTYFYDYRSDSALPPPVGASAFLDNTSLNHLDPAADGGRVRRVFSASGEGLVAPNPARFWTSADDHVGGAANAIESAFPGRITGVNQNIAMTTRDGYREVDIVVDGVLVQVKGGNARGLTGQVLRTSESTGQTVVGFAPDIPEAAWAAAARQGVPIARTHDELIAMIAELGS